MKKSIIRHLLKPLVMTGILAFAHFIGDVFFPESKYIYSTIFATAGIFCCVAYITIDGLWGIIEQ